MRLQFHGRTLQDFCIQRALHLLAVLLIFISSSLGSMYAHAAGSVGDTDGDSVPDSIDMDDDNDTIPDNKEGTGDADGDGIANCLDLDSDNDGIPDLFESTTNATLLRLLDANGDGLLDPLVPVGSNGLADVIEDSPESGTTSNGNSDLDRDGLPDHQDLDVDNDGIPDIVEAGSNDVDRDGRYDFFLDLDSDGLADRLFGSPIALRDTDDDGVFDFRDIDSDQDGLTDRLETAGVDTDSDGRVDDFTDLNVDGLHDAYAGGPSGYPDSDQDGFPDYRDIDSDGDGVTDAEEAFSSTVPSQPVVPSTPFNPGPNQSAQNNNITLETGESGSVFGCSLATNTANSDLAAKDSGFDPAFVLLFLVSLFGLLRRKSKALMLLLLGLLSACVTQPSNTPYAGIGLGASFLNANTADLPLTQDQSFSAAGQVTIGTSIGRRMALEARAADLGEATFTNGRAVGYQVADLSALYNQRFGKLSGFARIGVGALFNDGDIRTSQKNKTHLLIGAGADYSITPRLALRTEWQGHDADVMHGQFSLIYRFGAPARSQPIVVAKKTAESDAGDTFATVPAKPVEPIAANVPKPVVTPLPTTAAPPAPAPRQVEEPALPAEVAANAPQATDRLLVDKLPPVAETERLTANQESLAALEIDKVPEQVPLATPAAESSRLKPLVDAPADNEKVEPEKVEPEKVEPEKKIVPKSVDIDKDGIVDSSDSCPDTKAGEPVLADGCALFGDSVAGLSFFPDTDRLTVSARGVLDSVADALDNKSDIRVTIAVHTAPASDANAAMFLTRQRTIAIIRYLSDKGIDATRLRPEAFGDTQPLADVTDLSENDRVVLSPR